MIYLLAALKTKLIKVGWTDQPFEKRLSQNRRANADDLEVIGLIHLGDLELDSEIKNYLKPWQHHHEWFEDCPEVRQYLEFRIKEYSEPPQTTAGRSSV